MADVQIHGFYRVWFTWVDPISLFGTVYGLLTAPDFFMDALIPASMSTVNPDHAFFFHQTAALYLFMALIMAGILRASPDIKIWKIVQGSILVVDLSLLASLYVCLEHQGRLDPADWRWIDYTNLVYTGYMALLRISFLSGVGVKHAVKGKAA
jgi:hypothetical protein